MITQKQALAGSIGLIIIASANRKNDADIENAEKENVQKVRKNKTSLGYIGGLLILQATGVGIITEATIIGGMLLATYLGDRRFIPGARKSRMPPGGLGAFENGLVR